MATPPEDDDAIVAVTRQTLNSLGGNDAHDVQRIHFEALTEIPGNSRLGPMATFPGQRRWTRREYDYLIALGVLHEGEAIELIGGQIVVAEPKAGSHAAAVRRTADALRAIFGRRGVVRVQTPIPLDDVSEPQPDVAIVPGPWHDEPDGPPVRPALIVEVAEASLAFDRSYKGSLYARAGVADYWIVDVRQRALEVHREPVAVPAARFGWRYGRVRTLKDDSTVSPLAAPRASIAIARLFS
jgi:Uma2 family endonuclease